MFKTIFFAASIAVVLSFASTAMHEVQHLQSVERQLLTLASPAAMQQPDWDSKMAALQRQAAAIGANAAQAPNAAGFTPAERWAEER